MTSGLVDRSGLVEGVKVFWKVSAACGRLTESYPAPLENFWLLSSLLVSDGRNGVDCGSKLTELSVTGGDELGATLVVVASSATTDGHGEPFCLRLLRDGAASVTTTGNGVRWCQQWRPSSLPRRGEQWKSNARPKN